MMRRRPFRDRDVVEVRGTAYTMAHKAQLPAFQSPRPRAVRTSRHRPMDRGDRERADAALTERLAASITPGRSAPSFPPTGFSLSSSATKPKTT